MYTVDYFIKKFEAIPEEKWCTNMLTVGDRCCAYGHCGVQSGSSEYIFSEEGDGLKTLFRANAMDVISVNDNHVNRFQQTNAKERILAALYEIKAKQQQVEISDPPVTVEDIIGEQVVCQTL